jgi:hypothetical protein
VLRDQEADRLGDDGATTMSKALYVAYFTGIAGQSIGLFYIGDGILVGVDVATMQYDGSYQTKRDGSLEGAVEYVLPAGPADRTVAI